MSMQGRSLVILILVVGLAITFAVACGGGNPAAPSAGQVIFPDSNLEVAVREALKIPRNPIYESDVLSLTALTAHERSISALTGLEYCTNLVLLDLGENNINDISPLAGLTKVEFLILRGNDISDISALAGLNNLEILLLQQNNISDISALVTNSGLVDDIVQLQNNPLSATSLETYIPKLREKGIILSPIRCDTY